MMSKTVLLVEGRQDLRVIPELIEKNGVPWVLDFRLKRRKERQEVNVTNCQKSNDQ
jgi:uncharacterized protein YcgL (UPF0745 family)